MTALRYLAGAVGKDYTGALNPINDIRHSVDSEFHWFSTGIDPAFELRNVLSFYPGWYMVEMKVLSTEESVNSRLYFDTGKGYSEENSTNLLGLSGSVVKRLIRFDQKVTKIRFDPIDVLAPFSVDRLRIIPVTPNFAVSRQLKRVFNKLYRLKIEASSIAELSTQIENEANNTQKDFGSILFEYYNSTFRGNISSGDYESWILKYESPIYGNSGVLKNKISEFETQPCVSIVMPVYNVAEKYLKSAIDSVRSQVYENWQLCIVDDASTLEHIKPLLEKYEVLDTRINVVYSDVNSHIAGASNKALEIAKGDFIAFLDHDDVLAKHALYSVVRKINESPEAKIIYSDEDKIDENGERSSPYFKSAWNQDLFYSYNYICHFTVIKHDLIREIGGFRAGVDGSQDYDLLLRAVAEAEFNNIYHIPQILYHWRTIEGSVAAGAEHKNYTTGAGIKALQDHFETLGKAGVSVEKGCGENLYRVHHPIPDEQPLVSLIIPSRNGLKYLKPCIESIIEKTTYKNYEIIVIDNQSDEPATLAYLDIIGENERIRVIGYDKPFNYSAINNFAVTHANGELIGLINNDVKIIGDEWLSEMVSHAIREDIGCVGAKLLYEDETIQHAGVVLGMGGCAGHSFIGLTETDPGYYFRAQLVQNYSAVTAACLLVKKEIFNSVGGLDEENFKVAFNDVDFCLKVREAGFRNLWTPYATLFHYESKSRGYEDTPEKKKRFQSEISALKLRWSFRLKNDPAYNPNLDVDRRTFAIRG